LRGAHGRREVADQAALQVPLTFLFIALAAFGAAGIEPQLAQGVTGGGGVPVGDEELDGAPDAERVSTG
jgi:hypothetical protein